MTFRYTVLAMMSLTAVFSATAEEAIEHSPRTEWFYKAKWGIFTHYLAGLQAPCASVEEWNKQVDSFDVHALADTVASVGAKYYIITLGQNSGYYIAPNNTYDYYVGISPSKCSRRDLVTELYDALHAKGIPLMVYLPSGAPDQDPVAMKALEWKNNPQPTDPDPHLHNFQIKWEAVIEEWAIRWNDKVAGWWFDGCYYADAMYRNPDPPNFVSFSLAIRTGNPDSIIAFNPGVLDPVITMTPEEDYTAGEINEPEKLVCPGRWVRQAQYHMLSYLGKSWGAGPARYSNEQAVEITKKLVEKGAVITWDVPIDTQGHIPQPFVEQLRAIGTAMAFAGR